MPGPELPPDMIRLLAELRKRVAALEKRRPREVGNLDDLDDTEVLYLSPLSKPAEGDALVWDPDPSVPKFGGLWKPGWVAMDWIQLGTGGYVEPGTIDLTSYGSPPPLKDGWYFVALSVLGEAPADCCGWTAHAQPIGSIDQHLGVQTDDWHDTGLRQGIWTGSTGDSGSYGWQAPDLVSSTVNATGCGIVPVVSGEPFDVYALIDAWVLTDPGTSAAHYGAPGTTQVLDTEVVVAATMIRIAPL